MSININIKLERKQLYLLAAIMVFLVGVGYVIAVNPAVHGHGTITGELRIEDDNIPLSLKETGETGAGSLWQIVLDSKHLRVDSCNDGINCASSSGYTTPIDMDSDGKVQIKNLTVTGTCNGCGGGLTQSSCDWYMVGSGKASVWGWHEKICPNGQYIAGIRWYKQGERVDDEAIQIYCCSA